MPEELRAHLRYPEDLFRVQTNVYSKYQLDPALFFERDGAWSVSQAPPVAPRETATIDAQQQATTASDEPEPALATEASNVRFVPYYTMFGEGTQRDFVLLRPFVPFSRNDQRRELQAFMTASSDPGTYGRPHRVRGAAGGARPARRPAGDRQLDASGRPDQRADHAATARRLAGPIR